MGALRPSVPSADAGQWFRLTDVLRYAITDREHELGGDDEAIDNIAVSATYAMWCAAFSNAQAG